MISIVIPFVDSPEYVAMTKRVIENIRATTTEEQEIILVQQKGLQHEALADMADVYLCYPNPDMKSLGEIYNRGFAMAHGDVLVNLHNDVELPQGWNESLAAAARDGLIGCVFVDESESDCESRGIGKAGMKYIPSCCFSISRSTWNMLGGYDEQFLGWHWEDNDLFFRAARAGGGPVRCDVTVKHHRGNTRSKNKAFDDFCLLTNKDRYFQKHYEHFKDGGMFILTLPETANYRGGHDNGNNSESHGVHGDRQAVSTERDISPAP